MTELDLKQHSSVFWENRVGKQLEETVILERDVYIGYLSNLIPLLGGFDWNPTERGEAVIVQSFDL